MPESGQRLEIFQKETLIHGRPARIKCIEIEDQCYVISEGLLKTVQLEDEWYEDVKNPELVIKTLRTHTDIQADLFSFWQRLPDTEPRYPYHMEREDIAALPVTSFNDWWNKTISQDARNNIRRSEKRGVEVRETEYNDEFVQGMTRIFNETPVRQGRPFFHYGKDFETVKRQFGRYIHREIMIGSYFEKELIGFIMLGIGDRFARTGQIISYIKHRDKRTNNALIAKAVEVCERMQIPHLIYEFWTDDALSEFKRRCGFKKTAVPRYYIPLTLKGKLALMLGLHRGWRQRLPKPLIKLLKKIRKNRLAKRTGE